MFSFASASGKRKQLRRKNLKRVKAPSLPEKYGASWTPLVSVPPVSRRAGLAWAWERPRGDLLGALPERCLKLPLCSSLSPLPEQGAGEQEGLPALSVFTDTSQLVEDVAHFIAISQEDFSVYICFLCTTLS